MASKGNIRDHQRKRKNTAQAKSGSESEENSRSVIEKCIHFTAFDIRSSDEEPDEEGDKKRFSVSSSMSSPTTEEEGVEDVNQSVDDALAVELVEEPDEDGEEPSLPLLSSQSFSSESSRRVSSKQVSS
jgi:hypothetical protein